MSVNNTGVPLFAGIEDLDDMFIATMEEMDKDYSDEITIPHPVWKYLKDNKLIEYRDSIGTHVPWKIVDKPNSTVRSFTHYDDVDNTPQDALTELKFAYGHIVGTQMYSREELVKNSGKEQLTDLVSLKAEQLEISHANHFGAMLMGSQDANGRDFMGLGRVMTYNAIHLVSARQKRGAFFTRHFPRPQDQAAPSRGRVVVCRNLPTVLEGPVQRPNRGGAEPPKGRFSGLP